jgi:hypothetical protein
MYNNLRVMMNLFFCPYQSFRQMPYPNPVKITKKELDLMNEMRMLWEQHGAWTRMAIISIVFGLPDEEFVVNRLLKNPVDIANVLEPLYGRKIASTFNALLKDHLVIAAQLVKETKAGDNKSAKETEVKWYENANQLAVFLSHINPYWSSESWRAMFYRHLALVKAQAAAMLTKDYGAGINAYDKNEIELLEMADMMSEGIIKQFPYKI